MLLVGVEILDGGFQLAAYVIQAALAPVDVDCHAEKGASDRVGGMTFRAGLGETGIDDRADN